jgi:cobalt-zinc-cadmium efflux system outer membrane protein
LEQARERRPDLLALDRQMERSASSLALAQRQRWPDPSLSLTYTQQGTGQDAITPPTLTLSLSVALPLLYQQQGEIAKAAADARTQALQRRKLEAAVAADVETAVGQVETTRKLVERMRAGLLARARKARDLVEVQFQKGAASLLELLDAERTYIATHGEYLQNITAYWTAVAQLEQATAMELR